MSLLLPVKFDGGEILTFEGRGKADAGPETWFGLCRWAVDAAADGADEDMRILGTFGLRIGPAFAAWCWFGGWQRTEASGSLRER